MRASGPGRAVTLHEDGLDLYRMGLTVDCTHDRYQEPSAFLLVVLL